MCLCYFLRFFHVCKLYILWNDLWEEDVQFVKNERNLFVESTLDSTSTNLNDDDSVQRMKEKIINYLQLQKKEIVLQKRNLQTNFKFSLNLLYFAQPISDEASVTPGFFNLSDPFFICPHKIQR